MQVVKAPDSRLRIKTRQIKKITPDLLKTAEEMVKLTESFTDPEGVGLATTQVGREEKFFVAKTKDGNFIKCFNPKILSYSPKKKTYMEGCLSIPSIWGETERSIAVTVEYEDETGTKVTKKLRGIDAWIFQHETDHLNGTLFIDHVMQQKGKVYKVVGKDKTGADIFEEVKLV